MPTRKQRRRREKEKRHEYEYVFVDPSTGEEVDVEPEETKPARQERDAKASTNGKPGRTAPVARDARGRPLRKVQPPSWRRSAQRAGLFVVVLFLFVSLVGKHKPSIPYRVGLAVVYGAAAVPFFYWMDRMSYRRYVRVSSGAAAAAPKQSPKRKRER